MISWRGEAWRGVGKARHGEAWPGEAWSGSAGRGVARQGQAGLGKAGLGRARRGKAGINMTRRSGHLEFLRWRARARRDLWVFAAIITAIWLGSTLVSDWDPTSSPPPTSWEHRLHTISNSGYGQP